MELQDKFVDYETACMLKELGFPQDNHNIGRIAYDKNGKEIDYWVEHERLVVDVVAAEQNVVLKWLREKKNTFIEVKLDYDEVYVSRNRTESVLTWQYDVVYFNFARNRCFLEHSDALDFNNYDSYEDAVAAGIKTACSELLKEDEES